MSPRKITWPALLLLAVTFIACTNLDNDTLASIQGKSIPVSEFVDANPAERFVGKDNEFLAERIDNFIQQKVFTLEARAQNLADDPGVRERIETASKRQMMQYVFERAILDSILNDEVLQAYYDQSKDEIHARHILIQWEGLQRAEAKRSKQQALILAGRVSERLKAGEDFETLANEYTEDPSGKANGGDLGWFGWGQMVPPFQETAFALEVGEVSDIVETSFGYHIIKLEGRRSRGLGSLDEVRDQLQRELRRSKNNEIRTAANNFLEGLKASSSFTMNTDNVTEFLQIWKGSQHKTGTMDQVFSRLSYTAPLFTLNGKELGGMWIIEQLKDVEEAQRPSFNNENQFQAVLDQLVTQYLIMDYGEKQNYASEPEFTDKLTEFEDKYVYDLFVKREVNDKIDPTEEDILAYYERNKMEKYADRAKVQVREIFVKDEILAQDLRKRVDAGENFDVLAGRYTERKSTRENRGELPPFQQGRYGNMGNRAFEMEIGEIAGPIELGNGYSIIKLEEKIPEGPKPIEKVRGRIRTDVTNEMRDARFKELMDGLKTKYKVKVNYKAAEAVYFPEGTEPAEA